MFRGFSSLMPSSRKSKAKRSSPRREPVLVYPAIVLAAIALIYVLPSGRAILDDGDALYAHIAQQMLASGDWVTPYANGVRFLDKPPLMFWLMAASFKVFGVHEWAARLPTALGVAGTASLLWTLARRVAGVTAGLAASLGFVLAAGTLFFTLEAFPDIFLVFFLTLAIYFLLSWSRDGRTGAAVGFGFSVGGAALAKSLIGIFFPISIAVIFITVTRRWRTIRVTHVFMAFAIGILVALPWHILVGMSNPGFFDHYFINEQVLRFIGRREPLDYGSIPIPIFWLLLLVWFFPWSAFLPAALRLKERTAQSRDTSDLMLASWLWAGVVFIFFTFSSRLEHYSFPLIPPLSLLVGIAFASDSDSARRWVSRGMAALAVFGITALCGAVAAIVWWRAVGVTMMSRVTAQSRSEAYTNLFSPLLVLPSATRTALITPLVVSLLLMGAGTILARRLNRRGQVRGAVLVLSAMMLGFCLAAIHSLTLCEPLLSSKAFGIAIRQTGVTRPQVVVLGDFESANSINFYSSAHLLIVGGTAQSIERGLKYPGAPKVVVSRDYVESLWNGPQRMFLLGKQDDVAGLGLSPAFPVLDHSGRRLISNQRGEENHGTYGKGNGIYGN
jgi:4-amino-4-deoxy-L-arabinose transferase-like glycosyltransferase